MQSLDFNKRVTLRQVKDRQGHSGTDTAEAELTVWASVQEVSLSLQINAANLGMKADRVLHLWRSEFDSGHYNRVLIDGVPYRIENIGASVNEQYVKLLVSRG